MFTNGFAGARLVALAAVLAGLAAGGVSLSTSANASIQSGDHGRVRNRNRTIGQHNTTVSSHSPTRLRGTQNSAPTSSGGQNATMNALCRKAPCRIAQKVNMFSPDLSAFIVLGPHDYLLVP